MGPLGWLADLLVIGRYMQLQLETRNAFLKREAEAEGAGAAVAIPA